MSEEKKPLTRSEIDELLKEAESVHAPRRTVNHNRKKKSKIRVDRIIALVVIIALLVGAGFAVARFVKSDDTKSVTNPDNPLLEEQYPEISDVVKSYMEAFLISDAAKRRDTIAQYVDNMGDINEADIKQNPFVDSYSDIECYTKNGPYENTYVVYAYSHVNYKNIQTSAPSLSRYYVIRDTNTGDVYIHNGVSEDIKDYMDKVTKDEDVQSLFSQVSEEYNQALEEDPALKDFFNKMNAKKDATTAAATTAAPETTAAK